MASRCPLFRGENVCKKCGGDAKLVCCSEFRGGRFSEVANVLHKQGFQSVIATLSAVWRVSASRSVRSGRFYCTCIEEVKLRLKTLSILASEWRLDTIMCGSL